MATTNPETKLKLRPNQIEHFQRVAKILSNFYFYIDGSEMGTGKTYIATALAITYNLPCIVVCPMTARKTWSNVFSKYNIGVYDLAETGGILTYSTLRTRKGYQPKHGLLTRDDSGDGVQFFPTTLFTQIVKSGVLLIFDECQKLKNTSAQFRAASALIRHFYSVQSKSRIGLLSGTVMDKTEHAVNFLRMVGFITSRNLYSKIRGQVRLEGVEELHRWAKKINNETAINFIDDNPFKSTRKGSIEYVFKVFTDVIRPGVMSIMPRSKSSAIKDVKNGFYYMTKEAEEEYTMAIQSLSKSTRYDPETRSVKRTQDNMGAITKALMRIQRSKASTMIRVAKEYLTKDLVDSNGDKVISKIILFADYYEVIEYLLKELEEYNPVELTGRIVEDKRWTSIDAFQQQDSYTRVLIGNPLTGGLSVDLHDTTGKYPRYMFIMPGYRINELHQATGRTYRDGTVGTAYMRFFYGLTGIRENNILSALSRKGEVMQHVHKEQSEDGVKFPNEYEEEREQVPEHIHPQFDDVNVSEQVLPIKNEDDFEKS